MKIVVTGGLGFIGSNIAHRLVSEGHEVCILDNMHTGSEANIDDIKSKVKLYKGNAGEIEKLGKVDVIIHQGVYSSSPMYKENPQLVAMALSDWLNILEYARVHASKIVFASTSSMYNGNKPPHREDMEVKITDYYSETRYEMERLAKLYSDLYGMAIIGLRYFSVYGPREEAKGKYANLISQFLWEMQKGKQPLIFGDGLQARDFVYVDDVVEANMHAIAYNKTDFFNVGTGKMTSLNKMIEILNKKLGTDIKPRYEQNKIRNYVQETMADTKKTSTMLGFKAGISVEDGIERLIKYYSQR
ncbi:NAD-dependent epimerase/dehydratase family protein [Candidatus Micrarchaeota archaeon]|nr:NAD-dependent epimerase/dehydratase family protein [Candidatus Micrarchaeota archaeon]